MELMTYDNFKVDNYFNRKYTKNQRKVVEEALTDKEAAELTANHFSTFAKLYSFKLYKSNCLNDLEKEEYSQDPDSLIGECYEFFLCLLKTFDKASVDPHLNLSLNDAFKSFLNIRINYKIREFNEQKLKKHLPDKRKRFEFKDENTFEQIHSNRVDFLNGNHQPRMIEIPVNEDFNPHESILGDLLILLRERDKEFQTYFLAKYFFNFFPEEFNLEFIDQEKRKNFKKIEKELLNSFSELNSKDKDAA